MGGEYDLLYNDHIIMNNDLVYNDLLYNDLWYNHHVIMNIDSV